MELDLATVLILLGCGVVMGAINNLAGAAGALGLVGLEDAAGLDARHANASLRLGAVGIGLSGWAGFVSRGKSIPERAWLYGALAVPGAVAGAALALTMPIWVYRAALLTVLVLALGQQLLNRDPAAAAPRWSSKAGPLMFVLVGLHMGFIQVATGLVAIFALTAVLSRDLVEVNTAKMAVVVTSSITATAILAIAGEVVWGPSICLALGCAGGSFLASRWSVDKGHAAVRIVVISITVAVLARLIWQIVTSL